ncbi:hypothetical protein HF521_010001 [Silurus meridionalis]|uniref:Uncharacterized protein n=1 Tax=Silurus meridionalis TaxID=175797 RepID=A0A8T0AKY4_SILME|nr:hypothetical protein HF521_010001 [Silurus meridionalis]
MGSVTSALSRTRNTLVKVGSEPQREANQDPNPDLNQNEDSDCARRTSVRGVFPGRRAKKARAKASACEEVQPHEGDENIASRGPLFRRYHGHGPVTTPAGLLSTPSHAHWLTSTLTCCSTGTLANEDGESNSRPPAMFARSKSQSALWNTITSGLGSKEKVKGQRSIADDPRSPEEILAEEFPSQGVEAIPHHFAQLVMRCLPKVTQEKAMRD